MQRQGKVEGVKVHAGVGEMLKRGIGDFVWADDREGGMAAAARNPLEVNRNRNESSQGMRLGGAQKSNPYLC